MALKTVFGDGRDSNDWKGSRSSMPPRQRTGATYAGGKLLRKVMAKLGRRQNSAPNKTGYRKPGTLNPGK